MPNMNSILGSNPLAEAMQRHGVPLSALAQQTPSSASFQPDMQFPQPQLPLPDKSPMSTMGNMPPQGATMPQATPQPAPTPIPPQPQTTPMKDATGIYNSEAQMIIKALSDRLNSVTKQEQKEKE